MGALLEQVGWESAALDLFGVSAIVWFALYALVRVGLQVGQVSGPGRRDWFACGAMFVLCLLPTEGPVLAGFVALAAWLLFSARSREERSVAIIALALTGPLLWGPLIMRLLATELLLLDAGIAALMSGNSAMGNLVVVPGDAPDVLILAGCSAFKNIAPVFVLAATLSQLLKTPLDRHLAIACAVAVVGVIVINSLRLALIALYPLHYEYLHTGGGATLFSYATMLAIVAVIGSSIVMRESRRAV